MERTGAGPVLFCTFQLILHQSDTIPFPHVSPRTPSQCCGSGSRIRCFLTLGFRIRDRKKSGSGSGMNISDNFFESLETVVRVKKTKILWSGSGSGINITDSQHYPSIHFLSCYTFSLYKIPVTGIIFFTNSLRPYFTIFCSARTLKRWIRELGCIHKLIQNKNQRVNRLLHFTFLNCFIRFHYSMCLQAPGEALVTSKRAYSYQLWPNGIREAWEVGSGSIIDSGSTTQHCGQDHNQEYLVSWIRISVTWNFNVKFIFRFTTFWIERFT